MLLGGGSSFKGTLNKRHRKYRVLHDLKGGGVLLALTGLPCRSGQLTRLGNVSTTCGQAAKLKRPHCSAVMGADLSKEGPLVGGGSEEARLCTESHRCSRSSGGGKGALGQVASCRGVFFLGSLFLAGKGGSHFLLNPQEEAKNLLSVLFLGGGLGRH